MDKPANGDSGFVVGAFACFSVVVLLLVTSPMWNAPPSVRQMDPYDGGKMTIEAYRELHERYPTSQEFMLLWLLTSPKP